MKSMPFGFFTFQICSKCSNFAITTNEKEIFTSKSLYFNACLGSIRIV